MSSFIHVSPFEPNLSTSPESQPRFPSPNKALRTGGSQGGSSSSSAAANDTPLCRYFQHGYCARGNRCFFKHLIPTTGRGENSTGEGSSSAGGQSQATATGEELEQTCAICYEAPKTFGLL
ncbi:hypothetical protein HK102_002000, partial [Quaeritorhiza haematococci]